MTSRSRRVRADVVDVPVDLPPIPRGRAMTTEEKLASIPRCEGVEAPSDYYVPPRAEAKRHDSSDPAWHALLAQVGMRVDEDGRYYTTRPEPCTHRPGERNGRDQLHCDSCWRAHAVP